MSEKLFSFSEVLPNSFWGLKQVLNERLPKINKYEHPHQISDIYVKKYRKKPQLVVVFAACCCGYLGGKKYIKDLFIL